MRWRRFDNNEVNCTVQMYRHSRECIRRDRRFALISVHLEPIDVTPDIREGKQSTTTSKRPLKQALWRAFKITRALRSLIVVAALVIVNSACMLLGGWWQEWLASIAVVMATVTLWRWLPDRRRQPTV